MQEASAENFHGEGNKNPKNLSSSFFIFFIKIPGGPAPPPPPPADLVYARQHFNFLVTPYNKSDVSNLKAP